ncbi:TM248 protein, partial [Amia calva]|nr:TM248 protein [Amia calva]
MVVWQPLGNLRSCLVHQPPAVIFFLCLLSLAITFISFGAYTQSHEVKNPDIAQDWNKVLSSLASLHFCLPENGTDGQTEPLDLGQTHGASPLVEHETVDGRTANSSHGTSSVRVSFLVQLAWDPQSLNQDRLSLQTTLWGRQLGFKGSAAKEALNLTLIIPAQSQLSSNGSGDQPAHIATCLTITGPTHVLPDTPHPPRCPIEADSISEPPFLSAVLLAPTHNKPQHALECYSTVFTSDPSLTVMLLPEERALARHHLLLVSVCLLTLCGVLCFAGSLSSLKSRRHQNNGLDLQKEPLIDSLLQP